MRSFSVCCEQGLLLAAVHGLLIGVVSLVSMGSRHVAFGCPASVGVAGVHKRKGSEVAVHGVTYSVACGIFPGQASIPRPPRWQVDS